MSDDGDYRSCLAVFQRPSGSQKRLTSVSQIVHNYAGFSFHVADNSVSSRSGFFSLVPMENRESCFEAIGYRSNPLYSASVGRDDHARFGIFVVLVEPLQNVREWVIGFWLPVQSEAGQEDYPQGYRRILPFAQNANPSL